MQDYIILYEKYIQCKVKNNLKEAKELDVKLKQIEDNYRTNIVYYMRKVINDRIYGVIV